MEYAITHGYWYILLRHRENIDFHATYVCQERVCPDSLLPLKAIILDKRQSFDVTS